MLAFWRERTAKEGNPRKKLDSLHFPIALHPLDADDSHQPLELVPNCRGLS